MQCPSSACSPTPDDATPAALCNHLSIFLLTNHSIVNPNQWGWDGKEGGLCMNVSDLLIAMGVTMQARRRGRMELQLLRSWLEMRASHDQDLV